MDPTKLSSSSSSSRELIQALSLGLLVLTSVIFLLFTQTSFLTQTTLRASNRSLPKNAHPSSSTDNSSNRGQECDLSRGKWVRANRGTYYTNVTCPTLPHTKDCFRYGRTDRGFLNWKWEPDGCDLPRFDPVVFLDIVRGKTVAFVGDSVARNHADSLLCLLSYVEIPEVVFEDDQNRFGKWRFYSYNFTVTALWSEFLVLSKQSSFPNQPNSSTNHFDLYLDQVDPRWASKLPGTDYAVISSAAWFYRTNYVYVNNTLLGCYFCDHHQAENNHNSNLTDVGFVPSYKRAFRTVFEYINGCTECGSLVTVLRTFSPTHFEHGAWDRGGECARTSPLETVEDVYGINGEWTLDTRKYQVEELERARVEGVRTRKRFLVNDVTMAMAYRADGHPDKHHHYRAAQNVSDCTHWCLPGPIDTWNEILLETLKRLKDMPSLN